MIGAHPVLIHPPRDTGHPRPSTVILTHQLSLQVCALDWVCHLHMKRVVYSLTQALLPLTFS